jgi:hypothetical protein
VADKHQTVDVDTLEEVHRLLAETQFASVDQLAARVGSSGVQRTFAGTPSAVAATGSSEGLDPLPRRR